MKTKFNITIYNWADQGELAQARLKERACDLTILHMSNGDSKSLSVRKVSFDLSISTKLITLLVRDNETINSICKNSKHAKKKLMKLDFDPCELSKTKGCL